MQNKRGHLRIYLGMCPGVGKTYAMLQDAAQKLKDGTNLLVGLVETHNRPETQKALAPLLQLPRKKISHQGHELEEFDLDAALALNCEIILIDELAHTNAPTSRHPKRWQDVEELLVAGFQVWTTLNIQHVESLRDTVTSITNVRVQETVPDRFIQEANEIRLVDFTPEQLSQRMREGNIYPTQRAQLAESNFFREGNLRALREMALRYVSEKVDAEKRAFMQRNSIAGPWRAGERYLVAVGSSPHSARLIRITSRLAKAQNAGWIAAYVDRGLGESPESLQRINENLALARSLGGDTVSLHDEDLVQALITLARKENITQIIAGKAVGGQWWQTLLRQRIADRLQDRSGAIDLLLVHPEDVATLPPRAVRPLNLHDAWQAVGIVIGLVLLGLLVEPVIGYRNVALIQLLSVAVAGLFYSRRIVVCMALFGALAWNFFFTEPKYSFSMARADDFFLILTTLIVALVIGHLTTRLRLRQKASLEAEQRALALYQLTRATSASVSLESGLRAALRQIETSFCAKASVYILEDNGDFKHFQGETLDVKEQSVCQWVLDHQRPAGKFTDTLPESAVFALPILVNGKAAATLALRPQNNHLQSPIQRDLIETFIIHVSVLFEKDEYQKNQRETEWKERSRLFQRALLDHLSHEIKTPVAVLQSAAELLSQKSVMNEWHPLLQDMLQAAQRLNRVFNQLLSLSRAESGLVQPQWELCHALDSIQEILDRFPTRIFNVTGDNFAFKSDSTIVDTVLMNLIQNAVQYSQDAVSIHACEEKGEVIFSITNYGAPISLQDQSTIFIRFKRGAKSGTGGLGLGLTIAQAFSALIGGKVTLATSDELKTTFEFRFPQQP